ncbi:MULTISPECIES: hypothetical protein [unclassified Nitrosospira]|jgi:hypothetical protein|uniref:hypothetical protein n=1 Tax=unclassified Nitrosospira TaxID=2609267 RepID=UPI000D31B6A9|nr:MULTISPECIES: hypothetical protein [unclassified Nitrosospira]PTR17661.1 hypothetical protein C8R31_101828 [Nitrosospira sp. Nsp2]WON74035.1 hypothetical protein R5L00_00660 [Nitrosospira sp. Is2]
MKKLRNIDVLGYEAEEFDKWLEESTNKILKRTAPKVKRSWEADMSAPLKASRQGSSKSSYSRQRSL